jgi:hypothetical protein
MTRLVPDRPADPQHVCWLCRHNYSVDLHVDPDQPLADEFVRVHQP